MSLDRSRLRRLARANPKAKPKFATLKELVSNLPPVPMVLAEQERRAAEAEAAKAGPGPLPVERPEPPTAAPVEARPAAPPPPTPQPGMPPPEPQWREEKCRWRERGPADYADHDDNDGVYYETIHRYDPLERADEEEYYDPDE